MFPDSEDTQQQPWWKSLTGGGNGIMKMAAGALTGASGAAQRPSPWQQLGSAAGKAIGDYRTRHAVKGMPGASGPDDALSGAVDQSVGSTPQPLAGPAPIVPDAPWMKKKYYGEE